MLRKREPGSYPRQPILVKTEINARKTIIVSNRTTRLFNPYKQPYSALVVDYLIGCIVISNDIAFDHNMFILPRTNVTRAYHGILSIAHFSL